MHYLLCLTNDESGYASARPATGYYLVGPFDRDVDAQHRRTTLIAQRQRALGPRVYLIDLPPGEAFRPPRFERPDGAEAPPVPGLYQVRTGAVLGSLLFTGPLVTAQDLSVAYTAARLNAVDPLDCVIRMDDALLHHPPLIIMPSGVKLLEAA